MAIPNSQNPYLKTQVETASKEQLVVMLFDGIIRFSEQARNAIAKNEIEEVHHHLMRAQAIVMELIYTVDREKGGEIAQNLLGLHAYAFNCLIVANMQKDTTKIDEVQKIYRELREGWVGAMQSLGLGANSNPAPAAAPAPNAEVAKAAKAAVMAEKTAARGAAYAPSTPVIPSAPPAAPKPQQPGTYGMGKTAVPPTAIQPAANLAPGVQASRQSAMLSAYANGGRSIA